MVDIFSLMLGALAGSTVLFAIYDKIEKKTESRKVEYLKQELDEYETRYNESQRSVLTYRSIYFETLEELSKYKNAYTELAKERSATMNNSDKEVREAIRFAMINSHPDKPNGSQEDFVKFHKLYKRYCK